MAHIKAQTENRQRGFSLIEISIVVLIGTVLTAMAIPALTTTLQGFRTGGDASDINSSIALAKMRAAADFTRARVYIDLSANTFEVDRWSGTAWTLEGGSQSLSHNVTFGYGSNVTTPPSGSGTVAQAPLCYNSGDTATVANTACIVFNSRGIPVDHSGTATATDAVYVTDGTSVYGITVLATGLIQNWRTGANAQHWSSR